VYAQAFNSGAISVQARGGGGGGGAVRGGAGGERSRGIGGWASGGGSGGMGGGVGGEGAAAAVQVSVTIPSDGDVLVTCTLPATVGRTQAVSELHIPVHSQSIHSIFTAYSQPIHTAVQVSVTIPSDGDVLVTCTLPAIVGRTQAVSELHIPVHSQSIHSIFTRRCRCQ
jgi:hypothetical protein